MHSASVQMQVRLELPRSPACSMARVRWTACRRSRHINLVARVIDQQSCHVDMWACICDYKAVSVSCVQRDPEQVKSQSVGAALVAVAILFVARKDSPRMFMFPQYSTRERFGACQDHVNCCARPASRISTKIQRGRASQRVQRGDSTRLDSSD